MNLSLLYNNALDIPYEHPYRVVSSGAIVVRSRNENVGMNDVGSVAFGPDAYSNDYNYYAPDELEQLGTQREAPVKPIARPVLEERKVGKVLVHLVDQGFPNALMEVAKVMTWAGEVKQYKPHDWKNLPDAENGLEGAASRHRMEHNIQRQAGKAPQEITDHESLLLHKAHEAFNVLAELELIITKKIA